MPDSIAVLVFVTGCFVLGGFIKGVIGLGLPAVAMGLLGLVMRPAEGAALLVVPALVTNLWQLAAGPRFGALVRRLWPMLMAVCLGTLAGSGLLVGDTSGRATVALGLALAAYAAFGLTTRRFALPRRSEAWLGPLVGAVTGLVSAATGVFTVPVVPYLQAMGLDRDDLIQALGLSFTASSLSLAIVLAHDGALQPGIAIASLAALIPALAGMLLGQWLRHRIRPDIFRTVFFVGLLLLGLHLAAKPLL